MADLTSRVTLAVSLATLHAAGIKIPNADTLSLLQQLLLILRRVKLSSNNNRETR